MRHDLIVCFAPKASGTWNLSALTDATISTFLSCKAPSPQALGLLGNRE